MAIIEQDVSASVIDPLLESHAYKIINKDNKHCLCCSIDFDYSNVTLSEMVALFAQVHQFDDCRVRDFDHITVHS